MDSELLKQAIADAKAVRATALANAKMALEEAFTPKLQSMLSAKLEEESMEDETAEAAPVDVPMDVPAEDGAPAAEPVAEPAPVEEPVADVSVDTPVADVSVEEPAASAPVEEPVPEHENKDGMMAEAKLKSITRDPQGESEEVAKGAKKADKDVTTDLSGKEMKEKSNLKATTEDPQGASKEVDKGAKKSDKDQTSMLKENETCAPDAELDEIIKELEEDVNEGEAGVTGMGDGDPIATHAGSPATRYEESSEMDEEINLDELLNELKGEEDEEEKEEKEEKDDDKPAFLKEEISKLKTENDEYRKTVEFLRSRINEVNLLNAKLLYTTKLFKANNLDNSQKMKVVESFDRTKTVREVKLIYSSLAESFNFSKAAKKSTPVIKEVKKTPAIATSNKTVAVITEGLASKPVASTAPTKEIVAGVSEMASRFQKLAGIKIK